MSNYKGCMKVHAKTLQNDELNAEYFGNWANSRKRYKLLNKPRQYVIHVYLVNTTGEKDVTRIAPEDKLNKQQLSEVIHYYLNQLIEDASQEEDIDVSKSYLSIKVC